MQHLNNINSNKQHDLVKPTFHDFRPKTQLTSTSTNALPSGTGESKSQMILERDVSGLSPEPKAEIILSKNRVQRATKANKTYGYTGGHGQLSSHSQVI